MSIPANKAIFSRNLRALMARFGKDRGQVCADLGIKYTTFADWYNGNKYPRIDKIERLAQYFGVLKSDLIEDKGGRFSIDALPFPEPTVTDDIVTFYPIGSVAAGYDEIAYEEYGSTPVEIPRHYLGGRPKSDYFVLTVHGNSMYPAFLDGDKVLVLKQSTLNQPGTVGVILYEGENATLKKIEYVPGEDWLRLVPINPEYPPKTICGSDLELCRVLGVPRLLIREM